jgi:phosphoribosylformylglycinamidine synthase
MPIAHGDGNYYAEPDVVARLERNRQVVFRYVSASGEVTDEANPNGSVNNIAGLCNEARNVVGLMPHPERACELAVGSADGLAVFESILKWGRESLKTPGVISAVEVPEITPGVFSLTSSPSAVLNK